ncbi:hypothetical protein EDC94DRAFT_595706 [Helicostylum pulchrum]|nr:hypothetical protein EDC94DRAFT_595706 [Helicostylum pulchrum]
MTSLPSEVFTLIFNRLSIKDILQCQLTSKQWHRNSLIRIYTNVNIDSTEAARLFIQTISNSPQLGKYLDIIYLLDVPEERCIGTALYRLRLLEKIIQYCPNITEIKCPQKDSPIWIQLMNAGIQGRLPRLKVLPEPDRIDWESYFYTALSFKNSLISLRVFDFNGLGGYQTLCDQLDQFKRLQHLEFEIHQSYPYLTHFDGLVNKCPHLKELTFEVDSDAIQRPNEPEPVIRPHPGIRKLRCGWELICTENQLEYVMLKFPNLQSLRIAASGHEPEVSGPTLIKFVQYAMSTPDFELRILVRKEDLLNIFIEFMKTKNGCRDVSISYTYYRSSLFGLCNLSLSAKVGLDLTFTSNTDDNKVAHIRLLSEVGRSLRSLKLRDFDCFPDTKGGATSESIDRLFDILQLCPLLEECTIDNAASLLASHHKSNYPSLKKLSIQGVANSKWLGFLNSLSSSLPNLCSFSLGVSRINSMSGYPIVIYMPHSSLDLLVWNNFPEAKHVRDAEVYIKLKTEAGLRYYSGSISVLLPVDESCYLLATQNIRFDINCKDLKELRREYLSRYHDSWIF